MNGTDLRNDLKNAHRIGVFTHVHPDGDALGSITALVLGLLSVGKEVTFFTDYREYATDEVPVNQKYRFFSADLSQVRNALCAIDTLNGGHDEDAMRFDWLIALDCGSSDRLGKEAESFFLAHPHTLCVDHHQTNCGYAKTNIIDGKAAATAELVYALLREWQIPITAEMATALYVGIVTDTGRFSFSCTTEKTHQIAGELLRLGVDAATVSHRLYEETTYAALQVQAVVIASLQFFCDGKLAVGVLPYDIAQKWQVQDGDLDGMSNMIRNIESVDVGAFLRERSDGSFKISLRSGQNVDVSVIAGQFSGGGHARAAGYSTELSKEDAISALKKAVCAALL